LAAAVLLAGCDDRSPDAAKPVPTTTATPVPTTAAPTTMTTSAAPEPVTTTSVAPPPTTTTVAAAPATTIRRAAATSKATIRPTLPPTTAPPAPPVAPGYHGPYVPPPDWHPGDDLPPFIAPTVVDVHVISCTGAAGFNWQFSVTFEGGQSWELRNHTPGNVGWYESGYLANVGQVLPDGDYKLGAVDVWNLKDSRFVWIPLADSYIAHCHH
jgi:hypothetical protein